MKKFPVLQTDRLNLVEIKKRHLRDILDLFGNEKVTRFYNIFPFQNEENAQKFIELYHIRFKDGLGIRWGISLKGEKNIIGTIGFNNFIQNHRANIGYDLKPEYWNHGYMSEALNEVLDFGFNQLEINRIEAEVMRGNKGSESVLRKLNFRKEGVLRQWMLWDGKYYDMSMFALLRVEYEKK